MFVICVLYKKLYIKAITICISVSKGFSVRTFNGSGTKCVSGKGLVIRYLSKTKNPQKAFLCY